MRLCLPMFEQWLDLSIPEYLPPVITLVYYGSTSEK